MGAILVMALAARPASAQASNDSTAHWGRGMHTLIGIGAGALIGLGTGLALDYAAKRSEGRCTSNCDHITYSFEVLTVPIGVVLGGIVGLVRPVRH